MKIIHVFVIALIAILPTLHAHKGKISHKNKAHARKNSGWEKIFGQSKMAGKKVAPKPEKLDEGQKFVNDIKTKQDGILKFMTGILQKKEISKEEKNTLIKIFVYQQKLDKKIVDFKNAKETNEKILNLQSIKKELSASIEKLLAKKVDGVSEARVRADLIVIRDFLTNLNEKEANTEYQNLIRKISGVFQSGEEDELFAIHTYVDEILKNNKSQNKEIIQLISNVNDDYLNALHTLKNEGSETPVDTPSVTDLKSHIAALNEIINKVGSSKIQGVDIVALKDQLNEAVKKLELAKTLPLEINPEKAIEEEQTDLANHEDNEHYGKILNKLMGEPKSSAFDDEDLSQIDMNEGPKVAVHQIPNSFMRAVKDLSVVGSGELSNGIDDYLNFVDKTYDLNDVQKILAKKRKDRIMENIPNLCGKEILMWVKQELQTMFLDFQKAGMHPLKRIEAVKDLSYGLVDADDKIDDNINSIVGRCRANKRRRF